MAAAKSFAVREILEKLGKADKDYRYMGTRDLSEAIESETFSMDVDSERKVVGKLLEQLSDSSKDTQGLTVDLIGPICNKVRENQLDRILEALTGNVTSGAEEIRDISCLGLQNVVKSTVPGSTQCQRICASLPQPLFAAMGEEDTEVQVAALDVLHALLQRFGPALGEYHAGIQGSLLPLLSASNSRVQKKTVICCGILASVTSEALFGDMVGYLTGHLENPESGDSVESLVACVGQVSRYVGFRLGPHLASLFPLILAQSGDSSSREQTEEQISTAENCIKTFQSFVIRCPSEVSPFLESIVELCLGYISFDPNWQDVGDSDSDGSDSDSDDSDSDSSDMDDVSDDEDVSWKARKAAARCLAAIIQTRQELLGYLYETVAGKLIERFREREENVKADVFNTFIELLRQTKIAGSAEGGEMLRGRVSDIVGGVKAQLKAKSVKTRLGGFTLLQELSQVLPGALGDNVGVLVAGITFSLKDRAASNNLKMKALRFLKTLIAGNEATTFHPHLEKLMGPVIDLVGDKYYKTSADALRVVAEFVLVIRPDPSSPDNGGFDYTTPATQLYNVTYEKLQANDIDQEVKQAAIKSAGRLVAYIGTDLDSGLDDTLQLLLDRLGNEITRLSAVRAVHEVATSPLDINMSAIYEPSVAHLVSFVRKNDRTLQQSALHCLRALVSNYPAMVDAGITTQILTDVSSVVNDADLQLAQLALDLSVAIVVASGEAIEQVKTLVLPNALELTCSALLQGACLTSTVDFFVALGAGLGFNVLLDALLAPVYERNEPIPKLAYSSIAQCVAALAADTDDALCNQTVSNFIRDVKAGETETTSLLALRSIGEIGNRTDLSSHDKLQAVLLTAFDAPNEELKGAASFALGNVAVGNMEAYVPAILDVIRSESGRQFLLLQSLKEIISKMITRPGGADAMGPYLEQVWTLLFEYCEAEEEGTRNVVSECLGKLAILAPEALLSALEERVGAPSPLTRATIIAALKFAISGKEIAGHLMPRMGTFLRLLDDEDLAVRKATVMTLNFAANNRPSLIREELANALPLVYAETPQKEELVRIVSLGPFKHRVDDGAENRKAAFECLYTLLDTCVDRISAHDFLAAVLDGTGDTEYDIVLLSHLILVRVAKKIPGSLLEFLDALVDNLNKTITKKVKDSAIQQDKDRNAEMVRSGLRVVFHLQSVPNSDSCIKWSEWFQGTIVGTEDLFALYETVSSEEEDKVLLTGTGALHYT